MGNNINLLSRLLEYSLGGVPSNMVWDIAKYIWQKATRKSWEDLFFDSFQKAFEEARPQLAKYATDGEVSFSREQLAEALRRTLAIDIRDLTASQAISETFAQKLAQAMQTHAVLVIGGHTLT